MDVFIEFLGGSKGGKNLPGKPLNLYSVGVDSKTPGALNSLSAKLEDLKGSPSSSLWFIELVIWFMIYQFSQKYEEEGKHQKLKWDSKTLYVWNFN